MSDIFLRKDVANLLRGKYLLMLGCSNMRALYRDILWLLRNNTFVPENDLRLKLDFSYLGDRLLKQGQLNRGRDYVEMREYKDEDFHVRFNFLTKLYTEEVEVMMKEIKRSKLQPPDIVLINSCIWDITRWGPDGVNLYKKNMHKVMTLLKESLPPRSLVIYSTSLPVSPSCYGAFLIKQVEFMKHNLRFDIMEANLFAKQVVPTYGYNVLDFHYHLRMQIHWRMPDGVHWQPIALRHMNNILLTHIALCFGKPLPGNFKGRMLERYCSTIQDMKHESLSLKLSKLGKLFKDPRIIQQQLKRIPRHLKGNVNNLLKILHSQNNHPFSKAMRNTFTQNQNEMYSRRNVCRDRQSCLQDKENKDWSYRCMNAYSDSPNNNSCHTNGDRFSQSGYYDGSPGRRRFGPTKNSEICDSDVLRSPDSLDGRFYEGRNQNGQEYMYARDRNTRIHTPERHDRFPDDKFRVSSFCRSDERYNSNGCIERENFDTCRHNDDYDFRNDSFEFRRDNSPNREYDRGSFNDPRSSYEDRQRINSGGEYDRDSFNDPRSSYEDRRRINSCGEYDRDSFSCNDRRGSDYCRDENAYNGNGYHDHGCRNNEFNENRSAYDRGDDSGSENFYCDRDRVNSGRRSGGNYCDTSPESWVKERRGCNRFGGSDICFTNLEHLSYSNNNYNISGPYEQRDIFSPLRENRNNLHRQRRLPYQY